MTLQSLEPKWLQIEILSGLYYYFYCGATAHRQTKSLLTKILHCKRALGRMLAFAAVAVATAEAATTMAVERSVFVLQRTQHPPRSTGIELRAC